MTRRQHYADFYDGPPRDGRPLGLVHGNCQAEALRVVLAASPTLPWQLVRVPPVHELEEPDLAPLGALLADCSVVVAQPVRDGYRGLPLGTAQVAARTAGAQVVRVPIVRDTAVHPWQAIVRAADGDEPPVVPYHDLRTLTGRTPVRPDLVGAAQASRAELARREARDCDVGVSDLLPGFGAGAVHVLNHPTNGVLVALARRVQEALGVAVDAVDRGRALLGGIRAPLERPVLEALGLDPALAREHWLVHDEPVTAEEVVRAQRAWYASRPDVVDAGFRRHDDRLGLLGLARR